MFIPFSGFTAASVQSTCQHYEYRRWLKIKCITSQNTVSRETTDFVTKISSFIHPGKLHWRFFFCLSVCLSVSLSPGNGYFSRWTWVSLSRYQNVPILDLLELRMMEVVVTNGATTSAKFQSNCHHRHTNIQLFTGRMPFLSPNQQCQSTEGNHWKIFI